MGLVMADYVANSWGWLAIGMGIGVLEQRSSQTAVMLMSLGAALVLFSLGMHFMRMRRRRQAASN